MYICSPSVIMSRKYYDELEKRPKFVCERSGFPKVQSHTYNYNMLFKNENIKSNKTFNLYTYTIAK